MRFLKMYYGFLGLIFILSASSVVMADDEYKPVFHPQIHISRAPGEIKIDGAINDPGWKNAAIADHFVENEPGDQIKPPVDTKVLVTYDDNNLYLAFICYDNPEDVRASFCERDRIFNDDNIGFFFDTYGEAAWSYMFNVNPYGFQYDAIGVNDYGEDDGFDLVWRSEGQITDSGWQVEVAMPFSGLRFPNREEQVWRIEFWRHYSRDMHHSISWSAYDRNESCWRCNWGTMTGLKDIKPGKGVEVLASAIGFQSGSLNQVGISSDGVLDTLCFHNEKLDGDGSLGIKYSPSSNFTLEATLNPDFSQVEADAGQIDVNSTTALQFPERRPFFQEGIDIFRTQFNAVYTRMINDPFFAVKSTARMGRTSIGYMGAFDESSPVIIPFEEGSSPTFNADTTFTNIVRVRQTFGANSQVGLLATDRRFKGGGSSTIMGIDGSLRLSSNFTVNGQILTTRTIEPDDTTITLLGSDPQMHIETATNDTTYYNAYDTLLFDDIHNATFNGESFSGHGFRGALNYGDRNLFAGASYREYSPTFRLDNGYEPRNNRREIDFNTNYILRYDEGLIESISPSMNLARVWNFDGKKKDEWINAGINFNFRKAQSHYNMMYMRSTETYGGVYFGDIWDWNFHSCATPSKYISLGTTVTYGNRVARGPKIMGRQLGWAGVVDIRPDDRLQISFSYNYIQSRASEDKYKLDDLGDSVLVIATDYMLFKGHIFRTRLNYQHNKELSVRLVVQYDYFGDSWDIDPLITYRLTPFSMFYIGTTYDYQNLYNHSGQNLGRQFDDPVVYNESGTSYNSTKLTSRQIFMKLQYLFQI
ncbi:MAG: DUF5916 domain-containing protein [Candidatus Zixiibacteriota bacterium]